MQRDGFGDFKQSLIFRGGNAHVCDLAVSGRLKEAAVGVICIFDLKSITEFAQKLIERSILIRWNFESGENPPEVRPVVPVMKEADVPLPAECVQKLQQCSWTLWKLEAAQPLAFHAEGVAAHHVPDVKFREFVIGEIGSLVTQPHEIRFQSGRVVAAAHT